ncbi:hypothetical protein [Paludisphaera rhizosphaerae]|uniref:hypothetical protein n=1 Tax=Paludisphaera rhizosphaerae TaxID=2711216 RepID=UPI0013EBD092|nr:hypothetical protein [Paludisphaera rhizosphaerae]
MATTSSRPPMPATCCMVLEIKRLVTLGVLDGGVGTISNVLAFTDGGAATKCIEAPFRLVKSRETAILTIAGRHVPLSSWPMKSGRRFWQAACPECGRSVRKLWTPKGRSEWACRWCHRIIRPGRSRALDRKVDAWDDWAIRDWAERRLAELEKDREADFAGDLP